jgi:hypothetical protein
MRDNQRSHPILVRAEGSQTSLALGLALWNPAVPVPPPRRTSRFPDPFPSRFPQHYKNIAYFVRAEGIGPTAYSV